MTTPRPSPLHLVFAGGGTGGHIYPALAIAEHAARLYPDTRPHILCSDRGVDADILGAQSVAWTPLPARPPVFRPAPFIRFARAWNPSVRATREILRDGAAGGPTILIAMGGFVCPPAAAAARSLALPVALVNLDAVPGKANRRVASRADRIFSAAEVPQDWPVVGPIVRPALTEPIDPGDARAGFGLDPGARTLLITGGSLGAGSINDLLAALLDRRPAAFAGWQAIHQTGKQHDPVPLRAAYAKAGVRAWADHSIGALDMARAWAAADLSIGRSGAGTVAEAWATRTPAVFFPYPHHADGHQKRNARALAHAGAAIILDDHTDPAANAEAHASTVFALLTDPARLGALAEPALRLPPADGAERTARALIDFLTTGEFSDGRLRSEPDA